GFEALIRWNHPDYGLIPPIQFISLAESTGLIVPLGEWVITESFKQLEAWQKIKNWNYTLSINISPRHFLHPMLPTYLRISLERFNINPKQLIIEITENVAMDDFEIVQSRIKELRDLGFSVSID